MTCCRPGRGCGGLWNSAPEGREDPPSGRCDREPARVSLVEGGIGQDEATGICTQPLPPLPTRGPGAPPSLIGRGGGPRGRAAEVQRTEQRPRGVLESAAPRGRVPSPCSSAPPIVPFLPQRPGQHAAQAAPTSPTVPKLPGAQGWKLGGVRKERRRRGGGLPGRLGRGSGIRRRRRGPLAGAAGAGRAQAEPFARSLAAQDGARLAPLPARGAERRGRASLPPPWIPRSLLRSFACSLRAAPGRAQGRWLGSRGRFCRDLPRGGRSRERMLPALDDRRSGRIGSARAGGGSAAGGKWPGGEAAPPCAPALRVPARAPNFGRRRGQAEGRRGSSGSG